MPFPIKDMNRIKELVEHPELRTQRWKAEVNRLRKKIFNLARPKKLKDASPGMGPRELRDCLVTFVRRLNSDKGIDSLNTMEALVQAIHEQKLQDAMHLYNELMDTKELPVPPVEHLTTHEDALEQATEMLRVDLASYDQSKINENVHVLEDRVQENWHNRKNSNRVEISALSAEVLEQEHRFYARRWNEVSFPLNSGEMDQFDTSFSEETQQSFAQQLEIFLPNDYESALKKLKGLLASELAQQNSVNRQTSEQVCLSLWKFWDEKIDEDIMSRLGVLDDLVDEFDKIKADYRDKCRGPSRHRHLIDFSGKRAKLRKILRGREAMHKWGCWLITTALILSPIFYVAAIVRKRSVFLVYGASIAIFVACFIFNPLFRENFGLWWFGEAIVTRTLDVASGSVGWAVWFLSKLLALLWAVLVWFTENPEYLAAILSTLVAGLGLHIYFGPRT